MISRGVRMAVVGTGTGPAVRALPLAARPFPPVPPVSSDICARSSARSGVNGCGVLIASQTAKWMAAALRLDMRRAG